MSILNILVRKSRTLRTEIRAKGPRRTARIAFDRSVIFALSKIYRFPAAWHPPTSMRPYRIAVAEAINAMHPKVVCEVGCGLGSILSRVRAPVRIGYDVAPGVLRAASLIRSRSIDFRAGSINAVDLAYIDVLVLVNWIHEVSPQDLEHMLISLLPRTRYLMLDAIDADNAFGYRFKHDFCFLEGKAELLSSTRVEGEGRSFSLYKVLA